MKRSRKVLFVTTLALVIVLSAIFALSASAAAEGMAFSKTHYFDQQQAIAPGGDFTAEGEIYLDPSKTYGSNKAYVIYGNFGGNSSFDLLVRSPKSDGSYAGGLYVELYFRNASGNNSQLQFTASEANLKNFFGSAENPSFCKFSLSVNFADKSAALYLQGINPEGEAVSYSGSKSHTLYKSVVEEMTVPLRIGGDYRTDNTAFFPGNIKNVSLYKGIRAEADVLADMAKSTFSPDATDANLLFAYDLTDDSVQGFLKDLSKNKNHATNSTYVPPVLDNGFSFSKSDAYKMESPITPDGAMTFDALLTLPTDTSAHNWIVGNWEAWTVEDKSMGIQFASGRKIEVFICKGLKVNSRYSFELPEIKDTDPLYRRLTLAFSMDGYITCYLDGEQVGDPVSITLGSSPETFYNQVRPFYLGGDYRSGNTSYLKDIKVKSIAMYKGLPSSGADVQGLDAMFRYDLTDTSVTGYFSDLSGKSNDAIDANKYDESLKYDYSFAVIGDTQYMTRWDAAIENGVASNTEHLKQVYDWLLANINKKNIKYVMGLGDITDSLNKSYSSSISDTAAEWKIAYEQISRLNGLVPYSLVRGNHDNADYMNQYFNALFYKSQFQDPDYADNSVCFYNQDDITNAYTKFTVGSEKYLLLILDDKPHDDVVAWANEVIARNPDYRVIINTHTYTAHTGELVDQYDPDLQYCTGSNLAAERNDGKELWEKLVSKHANIALVLCGHDYKTNGDILRTVRIGENGNAVNEVLICPQSLDGDKQKDMKYGMVAMLYFSNDGKDIRVEYISTAKTNASADGKDVYYKADKNNINISLFEHPMETEYGYVYPEYVDEYLDTEKYPFAVFGESGTFLGVYDSFLDTVYPMNDGGAIYAAKAYLGSNTWDSESNSYGRDPKAATIILRRNYSMATNESYDNIGHVEGTVTLELNGYTITVSDEKSMFPHSIKALSETTEYETRFEVKNGTVKLGAYPLVTYNVSASHDLSLKPYFNVFTNVNIIASESTNNVVVGYSNSNAASPTIIFNGCTFDLTKAPADATVFKLDNTGINTSVTVNGGQLVFSSSIPTLVSTATGSVGSLTFGKTDVIGYATFTVPKGTELPLASVNGGALVLTKLSETSGTETYGLIPKDMPSFTFIPKISLTLNRDLMMNIYVPTDLLHSLTVGDTTVLKSEIAPEDIKLIGDEEYYLVSVALPSWEAARTVTLQVTVNSGEKTVKGTFYFSVIDYAKTLIECGNDAEVALARDVLSYIRAAYLYFGSKDTAAVLKINSILGDGYDENNAPALSGSATAPTVGLKGATFILTSTPTVRFYLSSATDNYEFFIGGKKLNAILSADGTYVDIDVYAYAMCETITYTINGNEAGSYHINSYYTFVTTDEAYKDNALLANLVARFAKYCESANAYRNSTLG